MRRSSDAWDCSESVASARAGLSSAEVIEGRRIILGTGGGRLCRRARDRTPIGTLRRCPAKLSNAFPELFQFLLFRRASRHYFVVLLTHLPLLLPLRIPREDLTQDACISLKIRVGREAIQKVRGCIAQMHRSQD
jgi:hypothetical protein